MRLFIEHLGSEIYAGIYDNYLVLTTTADTDGDLFLNPSVVKVLLDYIDRHKSAEHLIIN